MVVLMLHAESPDGLAGPESGGPAVSEQVQGAYSGPQGQEADRRVRMPGQDQGHST